jgi:3-oxoacyl-[acyl-carrier-protein] synthase-3
MTKRYARMTGWGKYVPEGVLTNADLEKMVDTSDEWIIKRTGIKERRVAGPDDFSSTMSTAAAQDAMDMAGVRASDLDLIIIATTTPDYFTPPVSSQVQDLLGAKCPAFTLVTGCTGWLYGLATAKQFIENGAYDTILIVGAEIITRFVDWEDRSTCVLFGDGAGASIMQASDEPTGILAFELGSDGSKHENLIVPGGATRHPFTQQALDDKLVKLRMNGPEVFKFAARTLGRSLRRTLHEAELTADDIDLFIPHQANARIIETAARLMRVPLEHFYVNIDRYGNTSAASIPIALCEAIEEGRCKPGDTLAFVSFGAGLTWASMVLHLGGPLDKPVRSLADELFAVTRARMLAKQAMARVADVASLTMLAVRTRIPRRKRKKPSKTS